MRWSVMLRNSLARWAAMAGVSTAGFSVRSSSISLIMRQKAPPTYPRPAAILTGVSATVPQALIAFLDSSDFEDAIRKAVSLGGDSDTLACITGGIAEAFYRDIPETLSGPVLAKLPKQFCKILQDFRDRTSY